jgi:hypothetical protein
MMTKLPSENKAVPQLSQKVNESGQTKMDGTHAKISETLERPFLTMVLVEGQRGKIT